MGYANLHEKTLAQWEDNVDAHEENAYNVENNEIEDIKYVYVFFSGNSDWHETGWKREKKEMKEIKGPDRMFVSVSFNFVKEFGWAVSPWELYGPIPPIPPFNHLSSRSSPLALLQLFFAPT